MQEQLSNQNANYEGSSLLDNIVSQTKISQNDDGYNIVKSGVEALIQELIKIDNKEEKVNKTLVDGLIARIDEKISAQMDRDYSS